MSDALSGFLADPLFSPDSEKQKSEQLERKNKEERQRCVQAIINYMGKMNPHLRDIPDYKHKLWDHLFIMSNFKLEVDSPYTS